MDEAKRCNDLVRRPCWVDGAAVKFNGDDAQGYLYGRWGYPVGLFTVEDMQATDWERWATSEKNDALERVASLQDHFKMWLRHNEQTRASEGIETTDATFIITPPSWPSHAAVKHWVDTLELARRVIRHSK
jgi:hypothetical protein